MKTDDLISQLTKDLKPVQPLEKPFVFAVKGTLLSVVVIVLMVLGLRPRMDLAQELAHWDTWLQLLGFAILLFVSLVLVGWWSSPGRAGFKKHLQTIFAVLAGLILLQVIRLLGLSADTLAEGLSMLGSRCAMVAMTVGAITGVFLTWSARQGASTHPLTSGLILGLAALGAGGIAITLHCSSQNGMHILVWHFLLPLIVMGAVGALIGRKFLSW